jgi:hypothetical protein
MKPIYTGKDKEPEQIVIRRLDKIETTKRTRPPG